jgi:hypothetical protein
MKRTLCFLALAFLCSQVTLAQKSDTLSIPVTARVDTTDSEVQEVVALWRNYLRSRARSAEESKAFWTEDARRRYKDPDLSQTLTYPGARYFNIFDPKVLSVEPSEQCASSCMQIRTLWQNLDTEVRFSPYALQSVFARRTDKGWKLSNALPIRTRDWERRQIGPIRYVYPPSYNLDEKEAWRAAHFSDSLATRFEVSVPEMSYYLPRSKDELARIVGLDYTLGPTAGLAYPEEGLVFSATGEEYYPHELAHVTLPFQGPPLLTEGLATYAGGSRGRSPQTMYETLHEHLRSHPDTSVEKILKREIPDANAFQVNSLRYATGAVFVRAAYERGGAETAKRLFSFGDSEAAFWRALEEVLNLKRDTATEALRQNARTYATEKS